MLKLKKWQIAILIASVILFIIEVNVLVNIFIGKSADTGSISDWLSASSDVAMAIAALYAAWLAKNWLKPNLQQQGLPKVVAFLQNELSESLINDIFIIDAYNIRSITIELIANIDFASEERKKRYEEVLAAVKKNLPKRNENTYTFINIFQFNKRIKEFEWYGFTFKKCKKEIITKILEHKLELHQCNDKVRIEVAKFNGQLYVDYMKFDSDSDKQKAAIAIDQIIDILQRYEQIQNFHLGQMRDSYKKLMGKSPLVTDFFDVKES